MSDTALRRAEEKARREKHLKITAAVERRIALSGRDPRDHLERVTGDGDPEALRALWDAARESSYGPRCPGSFVDYCVCNDISEIGYAIKRCKPAPSVNHE